MAKKKLKIDPTGDVDINILRRDRFKHPNPDPEFVYIAAEKTPERVEELKYRGCSVDRVDPKEDKDSDLWTEDPLTGAQTTPDTLPPCAPGHVWMKMPKEIHEQREAAKAEVDRRHRRDIQQIDKDFQQMLRKYKSHGKTKLLSENVDDSELDF